jgi:hypothetical protein
MIASRWSTPVVAVLIGALGGCAAESDATGWTTVIDTVGGTVRVTHTPGTDAGPSLVADEELRVGLLAGEGPESFGMIRSIAVLDDGRFAVADGLAEEVRLFHAAGRHIRTFGGQGQGPGELAGMQGVFLDHEGMLRVAEQENARLSVFHPDTGFVRSFPLRLFSYGGQGPWAAAIDSSGRTIVDSSGEYGERRYWNMLRVYDPSMRQIDSIPYHEYTNEVRDTDDAPGVWRIAVGNGTLVVSVPYFAQPRQVVAPSGELWSTPEGATQVEVARWTPAGDTSLVIRSRRPSVPVTPAERDSAIADVRSRLEERLPGPPTLDPSRVPSTKPPVYGLSLDERGRLWVRITHEDSDTTVYDIFEADGAHSETLALPFRVDGWIPPILRGDVVWTVAKDEADVQYVVRARVRAIDKSEGG